MPGAPGPTGNVGPIILGWGCEPGHGPATGTAVVSGTLAFAGADYLAIRVPAGGVCRDVVIPYNAVGMIVLVGMVP